MWIEVSEEELRRILGALALLYNVRCIAPKWENAGTEKLQERIRDALEKGRKP